MLEWWLGVALLAALASLFLLAPGLFSRRQGQPGLKQDNLAWFRLRRAELQREQADPALLEDLGLRLLDDEVDLLPDTAAAGGRRRLVWLLPLLAIMAALLYWQLGALPDVRLQRDLETLQPGAEELPQVMAAVAERAARRPDNLHYQALLGRFFLDSGEYRKAREIYLQLVQQFPTDAALLALAARASFQANGGVLDAAAQMLAERALSQQPQQRDALLLLAMASHQNGQYSAASVYWQRLLAMEQPGSAEAEMLTGLLQRSRDAAAQLEATTVAAEDRGVTVQVQLPAGAQIEAGDTLFVFARDADSLSPMPVAAKRFANFELPLQVRLDDSASMTGQSLSTLTRVLVIARISRNGQPGEEHANWQGQVGPLRPESEGSARQLVLRRQKNPDK